MKTNESVKSMVLTALLIAMVSVCTMAIQIPMPMTSGYVHLGDSMIMLIAFFFGKRKGAIAAGVGSMFADIFSGYAHWAPFTLLIKTVMGLACAYIVYKAGENKKVFSINTVIATVLSVVIMVGGYLVCGAILKGSITVALASVFGNIMQGAMGMVLFFVVGAALEKAHIGELINKSQI